MATTATTPRAVRDLGNSRYEVESASGAPPWVVVFLSSGPICECPAYTHRRRCAHVDAATHFREAAVTTVPSLPTPAPFGPGLEGDVPAPAAADDEPARLELVRETSPAVATRPSRFRVFTMDELLALPAPTWLLERHLPEHNLAVLYGQPGTGKSFLALAWAAAIALGQPWLSHTTQRGMVVFVSPEGGDGIGPRVQAIREAQGLAGPIDLLFVRESVSLLHESDPRDLLASVDAWTEAHGSPASGIAEHPALWIFDTMARCMPGGDENSAQDVGQVIAAADLIRQQSHAAVLLVHHTQKAGELERGSSALRGAADSMFLLKNEDGVLTLENTKQKDAPTIEAQRLRLVAIGPSCAIEPLEGAPVRTSLTPTARTLLETLRDLQIDGSVSTTAWIRASKLPERSAHRAIGDELLAGLYVRKERRGRYSLTERGTEAVARVPAKTRLAGVSPA